MIIHRRKSQPKQLGKKKGNQIGKEKVKLFVDGMIVYTENPKDHQNRNNTVKLQGKNHIQKPYTKMCYVSIH